MIPFDMGFAMKKSLLGAAVLLVAGPLPAARRQGSGAGKKVNVFSMF